MVERQLPKLHTGVRFPSPAFFLGSLKVSTAAHAARHDFINDGQRIGGAFSI